VVGGPAAHMPAAVTPVARQQSTPPQASGIRRADGAGLSRHSTAWSSAAGGMREERTGLSGEKPLSSRLCGSSPPAFHNRPSRGLRPRAPLRRDPPPSCGACPGRSGPRWGRVKRCGEASPPAGGAGVLQGARFLGASAKKGLWNASPRPPSRRGVAHAERCAEAPPHQAHPAPGLIRLPGAT
jgi:hypothetical protein